MAKRIEQISFVDQLFHELDNADNDANAAEVIDRVHTSLEPASPPLDDAKRLVQLAFAKAVEHPEWTRTPIAASKAFDTLIRWPRAAHDYTNGVPISEIEAQYAISRTGLYNHLNSLGVDTARTQSGRPRTVSHAQVRLASRSLSPTELSRRHGCSPRTVQRILQKTTSRLQPFIDRLDVAPAGEELRGAWVRYLDHLDRNSTDLPGLPSPLWPAARDRKALAAAGLAYHFDIANLPLPAWLKDRSLIAVDPVAPTPQFAAIQEPLTPAIVRHYNVIWDAPSFHSI